MVWHTPHDCMSVQSKLPSSPGFRLAGALPYRAASGVQAPAGHCCINSPHSPLLSGRILLPNVALWRYIPCPVGHRQRQRDGQDATIKSSSTAGTNQSNTSLTMDPLTITTSSIALLTTSIKIKRYLQSVANAPRVLERLSADCDRALHLLRAAQCRIDRRRRHDDDEETYQDIQLLLQDTVRSVFPHCLELRNEITHLSSVPTTRYEEIRRQALRSRDVSRLEAIYAKIHPMMEDIHMFEQATNAYVGHLNCSNLSPW